MKKPTCAEIRDLLNPFSLVHECDVIGDGSVRISTPFFYPDTSRIDVFVGDNGILSELLVSDMGQTADMLLHLKIPYAGTKKRQKIVDEICKSLSVKMKTGVISDSVHGDETVKLSDSICRVAQACIRVSDLYVTDYFPASSAFIARTISLPTIDHCNSSTIRDNRIMETIISTTDAAKTLKISARRVCEICAVHGIGRMVAGIRGRLLTAADLPLITARRGRRGNPHLAGSGSNNGGGRRPAKKMGRSK